MSIDRVIIDVDNAPGIAGVNQLESIADSSVQAMNSKLASSVDYYEGVYDDQKTDIATMDAAIEATKSKMHITRFQLTQFLHLSYSVFIDIMGAFGLTLGAMGSIISAAIQMISAVLSLSMVEMTSPYTIVQAGARIYSANQAMIRALKAQSETDRANRNLVKTSSIVLSKVTVMI